MVEFAKWLLGEFEGAEGPVIDEFELGVDGFVFGLGLEGDVFDSD